MMTPLRPRSNPPTDWRLFSVKRVSLTSSSIWLRWCSPCTSIYQKVRLLRSFVRCLICASSSQEDIEMIHSSTCPNTSSSGAPRKADRFWEWRLRTSWPISISNSKNTKTLWQFSTNCFTNSREKMTNSLSWRHNSSNLRSITRSRICQKQRPLWLQSRLLPIVSTLFRCSKPRSTPWAVSLPQMRETTTPHFLTSTRHSKDTGPWTRSLLPPTPSSSCSFPRSWTSSRTIAWISSTPA